MYCTICKVGFKMKRAYDTNQWDRGDLIGGHKNSRKHREGVTARVQRKAREEKERQKLLADGIEVVPKKDKSTLRQTSLKSLFGKKAGTGTQAIGSQIASPGAQSSSSLGSRSSPGSLSSPVSNHDGVTSCTSTTGSRGSNSCEGIVPSNKGMSYTVGLVEKYCIVNNASWHVKEM